MIKYLSPTSVNMFNDDPERFYRHYVMREARMAQTQPMAVGSAFDAFVKCYLYERLFGKSDDWETRSLFEKQVEKHNWDWAWTNGEIVFEAYKEAGCVTDLLRELSQAVGKPRFEFTVSGDVEGVPMLGKPDVFFINNQGARVIYDWKVNGYCGKALKTPYPGYVKLRDRGVTKQHRDCHPHVFKGITINLAKYMDGSWADQLSIYSWLLGEPVGSEEIIYGIDQICGGPRLRFATHRLKIQPEYQYNLLALVKSVWAAIQDDHYFQDLTKEESQARCSMFSQEMEFEGLEREAAWEASF